MEAIFGTGKIGLGHSFVNTKVCCVEHAARRRRAWACARVLWRSTAGRISPVPSGKNHFHLVSGWCMPVTVAIGRLAEIPIFSGNTTGPSRYVIDALHQSIVMGTKCPCYHIMLRAPMLFGGSVHSSTRPTLHFALPKVQHSEK